MNNHSALGLPPGSVRALLALILVIGFLAAIFTGLTGEALAPLAGIVGMVTQAYFHRDRKDGQ
jgi:hypothetical protein